MQRGGAEQAGNMREEAAAAAKTAAALRQKQVQLEQLEDMKSGIRADRYRHLVFT